MGPVISHIGGKKAYLTKFKVSPQNPETVSSELYRGTSNEHPVKYLKAYQKYGFHRILQGSDFRKIEGQNVIPQENGFVHTVLQCYNTHHNLTIRPDDVWIAIMTQFSFYINKHAEKFRTKFVNFEGQKKLTVVIPGTLDSAPYDLFVKLMTDEIQKNLVDDDVKNWILPNFSTTTADDVITTGVVFMASMKKYFKYGCGLFCGIPFVTLDGTTADWKEIGLKIQKLREYELGLWVDLLEPIIAQFIKAKKGKVDSSFWSRICTKREYDSGDAELSGWITAFCYFDEEGNPTAFLPLLIPPQNPPWYNVAIVKIPNGYVEVDVEIDDGRIHESVMFAGHFTSLVGADKVGMKPGSGWAIVLKNTTETDTEVKSTVT